MNTELIEMEKKMISKNMLMNNAVFGKIILKCIKA